MRWVRLKLAMSRRVRVINIDDHNQLDPALYAPFVELLPITSELDAQELLVTMNAPNLDPLDIFLVDIDMGGNWERLPKDLDWGSDRHGTAPSLRPYGPLLAVPFLASSPHVIFVPYSNWWASPEVYENGFVLLSCAFIFSRIHGRPWTLEETRDHIRTHISLPVAGSAAPPDDLAAESGAPKTAGEATPDEQDDSLLQEAERALRTGLTGLRAALRKTPGIQFVNVQATRERLAVLDESSQRHNVPLADPDHGKPITIEWVSAQRWEQVEVSSLYADILDFRTETDRRMVRRIDALIEAEFEPGSVANVGTIYEMAKEILSRCRSGADEPVRIDHVVKALKEESKARLEPDEWQLITRLAVLFAWVKAWEEGNEPEKLIIRARWHLGFAEGERNKTIYYRRLFLVGAKSTAGKGRWNQPFRKPHSHGTRAEDFNLDADQAEGLTPLESRLCQRYADLELKWSGYAETAPRYPRWMTEPDVPPRPLE